MRKTLLSMVAMMATSGAVMAQSAVTEIPSSKGLMFEATALSPNGRYLGGTAVASYTESDDETDAAVGGVFLYDKEKGEVITFSAPDADTDAQIKCVANTGVAVGWNGPAATFDFATKEMKTFGETDQYLFCGISPDGKLIVGARYDDEQQVEGIPCMFNDGTPVDLSEPSDKFLGGTYSGSSALSVSNDSIISGYWVDDFATRPAIMWAPNRDGKSFMAYPFSRPYFAPGYESTLPYAAFSCDQTIMSANGKYIVINYEKYTGEWESVMGVARYNTSNDSIEFFVPNADDELFADLDPEVNGTAVSDDGTIVGFYGGVYGTRHAFIWKKGEDFKSLASEFPTETVLGDYDDGGVNTPCGISADGRYIAGFAYKYDENDEASIVSYILDTQYSTDGVEAAPAADSSNKVVARYTADGKRVKADAKLRGLNMLKLKGGKTIKTINK